MKKELLLGLIVAVSLFATFAGPTAAAPITMADAGDDADTDNEISPNNICVDADCTCVYNPISDSYSGDCDDYT